jgi:hypothetical protein
MVGMCFVVQGKTLIMTNNSGNPDKRTDNDNNLEKLKGSRTDPQKTEMEGLKKGGVEPNVHPDDKPKDEKGRTES